MDTPAPEFDLCWSCQKQIRERSAVWITPDLALPCCKRCWRSIPVDRRLELAQRFHDRSDRGLGVEETLSAIRDLIHSSFGGYFERRTDTDPGRNN